MGYQIHIEGGLPSGGQSELHHVREVIGNAVAELQNRGHQISTSFIKHPSLTTPREEAHNFQDPNERARYQQEQDNWSGTMREAREEAMRMSSGAAQKADEGLPGQEPVRRDVTEDQTSPLTNQPVPGSSSQGSVQTTVVDRGTGAGGQSRPTPESSSVGPPQTPKATTAEPKAADRPDGKPNPAPPAP